MSNTPTDEELEALARKHGATSYRNRADTQHPAYGFTESGLRNMLADAVAEWGCQPAGAGEPVAVIEFTDCVKEPRIMSWNALPSGQHRVYATPQPTQAQAGAADANYHLIDRFLRNNLYDDDYAEYSAALDALASTPSPQEADTAAAWGDDVAVDMLSGRMKGKLAKQRAKGYGGWDSTECTQQHLSNLLRAHVDKGDPVDVANFCAFLSARGEGIAAPAQGAGITTVGGMVSVCKEDANRYCEILTLLGMEEEGDPVAEVQRLQDRAAHAIWSIWEALPGYLIDNCEDTPVSEEMLQHALSKMLADPQYKAPDWAAAPQPAPPADSVLEDAARLDWLDQQCGGAYGFEDMHEGNRWEIMGAYANVRQAIDAERAACKQGGQKP